MTNEELAAQIQAGERDRLLELRGQVERFAYGRAIRWGRALGECAGVTVEDLLQAVFLALLDALERWEPERRTAFTTCFGICLKGAFSVACGVRTPKMGKDPFHSAVSLDMPADPSIQNGETLGDLQPDPAAEAEIEAIDERDRLEKLHAALERVLETLPPTGPRRCGAGSTRGRGLTNGPTLRPSAPCGTRTCLGSCGSSCEAGPAQNHKRLGFSRGLIFPLADSVPLHAFLPYSSKPLQCKDYTKQHSTAFR